MNIYADAFAWNRQFAFNLSKKRHAYAKEEQFLSLSGRLKCLCLAAENLFEGTAKCGLVWTLYFPILLDKAGQFTIALYAKAKHVPLDNRLNCKFKTLELLDFAISPLSIPALTLMIVVRDLFGLVHPGILYKKYAPEQLQNMKARIKYQEVMDSKWQGFDLLTCRWMRKISCKQQEELFNKIRNEYLNIEAPKGRYVFLNTFKTRFQDWQTEANANIRKHLDAASDDVPSLSTLFDRFVTQIPSMCPS